MSRAVLACQIFKDGLVGFGHKDATVTRCIAKMSKDIHILTFPKAVWLCFRSYMDTIGSASFPIVHKQSLITVFLFLSVLLSCLAACSDKVSVAGL